MTSLVQHPERNVIRLQLKQNMVLEGLNDGDHAELEPHLTIIDGGKGDFLLHQGVREMQQYFILDGMLKRVVSNADGKEMRSESTRLNSSHGGISRMPSSA